MTDRPMMARQHEGGAEGRVQEELDGGVATSLRAPYPDDEVHRDQHRLEEDEEQEQVERYEHSHQGCFQEEDVDHELLAPLGYRARRRQGDRHQQGGQHDEGHRDPVDPDVPGDPPGLVPGGPLHELVTGHGLEGEEQVAGQTQRQDGECRAEGEQQLGSPAGHQHHRHRRQQRKHDQPGQHDVIVPGAAISHPPHQ